LIFAYLEPLSAPLAEFSQDAASLFRARPIREHRARTAGAGYAFLAKDKFVAT
jgi:hypothetical protein